MTLSKIFDLAVLVILAATPKPFVSILAMPKPTTIEGYQPTLKTGLKTQEKRDFPMNQQLRTIVTAHKPKEAKSDDFVFTAKEGGFIRVNNFANIVWCKIIELCGLEYRKPYQTRHTFITLCLDAQVNKDVAKWVGNSPEIIYCHYAAHLKSLAVPEL